MLISNNKTYEVRIEYLTNNNPNFYAFNLYRNVIGENVSSFYGQIFISKDLKKSKTTCTLYEIYRNQLTESSKFSVDELIKDLIDFIKDLENL